MAKKPRADTGKPKPREFDLAAMQRIYDAYYPEALKKWEADGKPLRHVFHDLRTMLRFIEFHETGYRRRIRKEAA